MKYYVYKLIDPRTSNVFYVGKGSGNRAWTHAKFKDGNNNYYKDSLIKEILESGLEPIIEISKRFVNETDAYDYEESLIENIGLDNLTNIVPDARPPSKKGWSPSDETRDRRRKSLSGIPRSTEWRERLSESKSGSNNPRYGIKEDPKQSQQRRIAQIKTKNKDKYDLYKEAILLLNEGTSYSNIAKTLGVGKNVCSALKNGTHGILEAFPELNKLRRS